MADIPVVCANCNKAFQVSEFVDPERITCPVCAQPVRICTGGALAPGVKSGTLKLKQDRQQSWKRTGETENGAPAAPSQADLMKDAFAPQRHAAQTKRFGPDKRQILLAWLLFALTGAVFYWLRYGGLLPEPWGKHLKDYGWILVAVVYLVTVTTGFSESALQGIMCLLIPGYFLYFLVMADRLYLRALTFGMLFGVGPDTWRLLRKSWFQFYESAMAWILSGGA